MMGNTSRRESTRTVILALLLSRKGGCTLTQLDNDYRELEGERIPWKEFGCVSLLNFLQSIPQTVQIESRGSDFIVKGIPSNKSKHVSTLVTEQKNQCKKPPIGRKYFKPIYPNYYYPKPSMPRYYPLSVEWLARIVNIVNEYPDGVNKDYVFNMVSSCLSHVNISAADMDYQLQQLSHKLFVADNKIYPIESRAKYLAEQNKSMDFQKKGEQLESQYGVSHSNDKKWETSVITISGDEDQNDLLDGYDGDECYAVPSGYTPHYSSADINTKSTNNFNDSVSKCPYQTSTNEAAMQGTNVQIKQNHLYDTNNINNICVPSNEREMHNVEEQKTHYFNTKDTETLINDRLKFRLEKLIQNHPDGIWCADLPDKYLEEYKVSLNYLELGFSSVRDFTAHLPEIFHCIQLDPMGDFMLYYAKNEIPSNKKRQRKKSLNLAELHEIYMHDDEIEALPLSVSMDICKELIPDDVMTIGETVGYLSVTELAQEDTLYHEVIVVEVFTPSFFWIQLRKKQLAFKKFMSDLDNFYAKQSNQYKIPTVVLEKGLNCACKYGGIWHRAIIKTVRPDLQVTVLFYDYGTLKTYPFEAIHYLHRKFSHPPAQAIPCGLVNTRPCNDSKWSHHATQEFGLRAMKGPLCAVIASTNPEDNSMMVTLTDTINDDDLHINDWMVEQKLAEHGKMVCMKFRNFPFRYYLECQERLKRNSKTLNANRVNNIAEKNCLSIPEKHSKDNVALYDSCVKVERTLSNVRSNICEEKQVNAIRDIKMKGVSKLSVFHNPVISCVENSHKNFSNTKLGGLSKLRSLYKKILSLNREASASQSNNSDGKPYEESWDHVNKRAAKTDSYSDTSESSELQAIDETVKSQAVQLDSNSTIKRKSPIRRLETRQKCDSASPLHIAQFRIRDSDEESETDMEYFGVCSDDSREIENIDWSTECQNANEKKKALVIEEFCKESSLENCSNLPSPDICFLRAVRNSKYFSSREEQIQWSQSGNIVKSEDTSILRQLGESVFHRKEKTTVAIPQKTLEMLIGKKLTKKESSNTSTTSTTVSSQNKEEAECHELQETVCKSIEGQQIDKDDDVSQTDSDNSPLRVQKFIHMQGIKRKMNLLQMLEKMKSTSSDVSNLDSDDLSNNESRSSEEEVIPRSSEDTTRESIEDSYLSSSNEESSKSNVDVDVNMPEETYSEIFDRELQSSAERTSKLSTADESETLNNSEELNKCTEVLKAVVAQSPDSPDIPVFNDLDVESGEEEWDGHLSLDNMRQLFKNCCPQMINNYSNDNSEYPKITEIDD